MGIAIFLAGFLAGGAAGVLVMALCNAARARDEAKRE